MPIPKPKKGEKQSDFVSRCMGSDVMKKEFPDQEQRNAVCYDSFRKNKEDVEIKRDTDGKIIVAENVPLIFTSSIESDDDVDKEE